jgi:hypothetical protein
MIREVISLGASIRRVQQQVNAQGDGQERRRDNIQIGTTALSHLAPRQAWNEVSLGPSMAYFGDGLAWT